MCYSRPRCFELCIKTRAYVYIGGVCMWYVCGNSFALPGGAVTRVTPSGFANRNLLESSSHSLGADGRKVNDPFFFVGC